MPTNRARLNRNPRQSDELTPAQIAFLIHGESQHGEPSFETHEDARRAWIQNRDLVLGLRDAKRGFFRTTYPSGSRPWAFWAFEHPEVDSRFEFRALEKMGLINDAEREAAGKLALEDFERFYRLLTPVWQQISRKVTKEQLLDFWPQIVEVNRDGTVYVFDDDDQKTVFQK